MGRLIPSLAIVATLAACSQPEPDFRDINGNGYRYADFAGKWRIVNYWATWCGPCIHEIPELNHLAETQAGRLVVLGVNYDEPEGEEAIAQAKKMKITFPVYALEPSARLGVQMPEVLPTTFVFAPDGTLKATLVGPQTEASLLEQLE